jgi:hypothetical protein
VGWVRRNEEQSNRSVSSSDASNLKCRDVTFHRILRNLTSGRTIKTLSAIANPFFSHDALLSTSPITTIKMAIPGYDDLVYYATPPNSYIGATIFLFYIVAALYATCAITYSLYTQYTTIFHIPTSNKDEKLNAAKVGRVRHIKIYAFLASVSFATLSYNMLMFLITHYLDWTGGKNRSLSDVSGDKLKRWMLESTLFQEFAKDLVKDAPNAVWTQAAILATWFWNIWMGQKGIHGIVT